MKKLAFISLAALMMAGCQKENVDYFVPYHDHPLNDTTWAIDVPTTASVYQLSALLSKPAIYDSFDAATGAGVHHADFDINVPQNTCIFSNGTSVTGIVRLEIKRLMKKGDFIRYARPTTSFGNLLESGGAFYIKATTDGKEVFINHNKKVGVVYKEENPLHDMSVFYGQQNLPAPQPEGTNPLFTWMISNDSSRVSTYSIGNTTGYSVMTGEFNWINCSRYIDTGLAKTFVTAILPANFTNMTTTVYAVLKQKKTVVQLVSDASTKTFYAPNFPLGTDITLVSLTVLGNTTYLGIKDVTVSRDLVVSVNPAIKTVEEIGRFLDGL